MNLLEWLPVSLLVVVSGGLFVVLVKLFVGLTAALEPLGVAEVDDRRPEAADLFFVLGGLEIWPAGVAAVTRIQLALSTID